FGIYLNNALRRAEIVCSPCLVLQAHRMAVYFYMDVVNYPDGSGCGAAAAMLPQEGQGGYKGRGTPGVCSDHFRYAALKAGLGVYADLDIYCQRPMAGPFDYLMAWERPGSVNGAVLYLPPDAPLLADLISVFEDKKRPLFEPHLPPLRRLEVALR